MSVLADLYDRRDHLWAELGWAGLVRFTAHSLLDKFLCWEEKISGKLVADIVLMIEHGPGHAGLLHHLIMQLSLHWLTGPQEMVEHHTPHTTLLHSVQNYPI